MVVEKYTLIILAFQLLAMFFVKLFFWKILRQPEFYFPEMEKICFFSRSDYFDLSCILVINKYFSLPDGGHKKA